MLFLLNEVLNVFFIWEAKFYFYSFFLITIKLTRWSANLSSSHSYYFGIICGPIWGSFTIEDHLWSILGISCGWGSSYCTELRENLCHFLPYLKIEFTIIRNCSVRSICHYVVCRRNNRLWAKTFEKQYFNSICKITFRPATSEFCQAPNLQCELLGVWIMEGYKSLSKSGYSVSHFFPSHEPLIILYLVLLFSGVWKSGKVTHPGKVQH